MATVHTATGPIDSADLGNVLVHEHVFVVGEEFRQNYQDDWDEDEKVAEAVRDLTELKELGIDTILDPTVLGLGRYIPRIQRIAEQIDLNIVVATGLYTYNDIPFQFHYAGPGMLFDVPEPLVTLFTKDLTEGIADTGVRAAFLKCAIESQGLTPGVERVMRAVGQTSAQTGAPITVHTDPHSQSGLVAQKIFAEEGADLTKVVIGHSGDSVDLDYLMKLADAGSVLGMDRFGLDLLLPFDERVNTVAELCKRGYADRMALAHDAACFIDWFDHEAKKQALPKWNYRHISEEVLPALRERGVGEADITTMLVDVPRRYFE
ncbi:phosphotriesterase-related protein [Gordonia terrae]|uniref:phosphotriesterase family protein n=1 Tax=Gordonia terrae TaxID=2055 RepID=UPI00200A6423|nr:phosphotriesterase-related protein [Gordonia terrae]UPW09440.1 phosphotriesterase-related protein [Gordonia terrae]